MSLPQGSGEAGWRSLQAQKLHTRAPMALTNAEELRIRVAASGVNRALYTTPSGEFQEVLRDIAQAGRARDIANAINLYVGIVGRAPVPFIKARLPGILTNRLLPSDAGIDHDAFYKHMVATPADMDTWCVGVHDACQDPDALQAVVEGTRSQFPA